MLVTLTGIQRTVDADLTAIAERRVVGVQSDWSHNGWDPSTAEVLAWNSSPDPVTTLALQWQDSPEHWGILTDPSYERIGCAIAQRDWQVFGVCVLATGTVPAPLVETEPAPAPPVELLPNTAVRAP